MKDRSHTSNLRQHSPKCDFYAVVGHDGRLRIWDTSTGDLKFQLHDPKHVNARYTSMAWGEVGAVGCCFYFHQIIISF